MSVGLCISRTDELNLMRRESFVNWLWRLNLSTFHTDTLYLEWAHCTEKNRPGVRGKLYIFLCFLFTCLGNEDAALRKAVITDTVVYDCVYVRGRVCVWIQSWCKKASRIHSVSAFCVPVWLRTIFLRGLEVWGHSSCFLPKTYRSTALVCIPGFLLFLFLKTVFFPSEDPWASWRHGTVFWGICSDLRAFCILETKAESVHVMFWEARIEVNWLLPEEKNGHHVMNVEHQG